MLSKTLLASALASILGAGIAHAADLGTKGSTWEITEPDFRERLSADAKKVDWEKVNAGIVEGAKDFVDNQNQWGVYPATIDSIRHVDLTQRLTADIKGFDIQPDGTFKEKILFKKGHTFNPIAHLKPQKWFVVINGESDEQVNWVSELENNFPGKFVYMAVDGKISALTEKVGVAVVPTIPWVFATAGVTNTPAIIGVTASNPDVLTVAQFQPPYSVDRTLKAMK